MLTGLRRLGSTNDLLGEGPIWSVADECFYWVDIRGCLVRQWTPATNEVRTWAAPSFVGSIAPREKGGLLVALQSSLALFEPDRGVFEHFVSLPEVTSEQRTNDGKCDPAGRFWVGTMNIVTRLPDGILYCIEPTGEVRIVLRDLAVPNSLSWDSADTTMYFSQTRDRKMLRYAFDVDKGAIDAPSLFFTTEPPGTPDGATVDAEDHLVFAEYGNGRLVRLDPQGEIAGMTTTPCRYPTNCAFGGGDFRTALITSSNWLIPEDQRSSQPKEGAVYVARSDVPGVAPTCFKL